MLGRPDSDIVSTNHLRPKKTRDPGPGQYQPKDIQFEKPTTKFSKGKRSQPGKKNGMPAPDHYNPEMVRTESGFYRFPQGNRFNQKGKGMGTPGPGMYETMRMPSGQMKSMLGGTYKDKDAQVKDNGVPGPGTYHEDGKFSKSQSVPGFVMKKDMFTKKEKKQKGVPVGPWKYSPEYPTHTSYNWKIGTGQRGDNRSSHRLSAPGPGQYKLEGQFEKAVRKPKFSMGKRPGERVNKAGEMPGPGEYQRYDGNTGQAALIGTGQRSDLGVGKAFLAPGPGQYTLKSGLGKTTTFGKEKKKYKVKKTYDPGPGTYNLPGTVGNVPSYLLVASKMAAKRLERSRSAATLAN